MNAITVHDGATTRDELEALMVRVKKAQALYADFSQAQVDEIFLRAALAANQARIPLAQMAVTETGMGIVEDKVIKNHFASEFIYNKYHNEQTCGVLEDDKTFGIRKIAEPLGIIAGVVPTTNPTSTAIFKALIALKTRNAIVFAPHPRAKASTCEAARIIRDAAVAAGAPQDIVAWISEPTLELTGQLMKHKDTSLILATGGPGMVKAAYSSGKPAIGVGSGNTPAVIDETADLELAVSSILLSKTFDNGLICASEQSVIAVDAVYDALVAEMTRRGAHLCTPEEKDKLAALILQDGKLNSAVVGQPAAKVAALAGFEVPPTTQVLLGAAERIDSTEAFAYEKLSPILGLYRARDFDEAVEKAAALVEFGGLGHTAVLYTGDERGEHVRRFERAVRAGRILVNMPSSQGAIGDIYNFKLEPSLTLGCGSWGRKFREREHRSQTPDEREDRGRPSGKHAVVPGSSQDLPEVRLSPHGAGRARGKEARLHCHRQAALRPGLHRTRHARSGPLGIEWDIFRDVEPDPTFATVNRGLARMDAFGPDVIIGLGGGSPMDAAKIMWVLYEYPGVRFEDLALRFMDIRKRVYRFPQLGRKAMMVAIPTTSGTGSEVTPFAVVTDEKTGLKYPIADYELTPDIAIVDPELVLNMPRQLTAWSGIDAVVHCLETMVSVYATEYTNALALEALRLLFKYLPAAYANGATDVKARSKVHNASTMAGMAFANGFLGICHSMAHKLGARFHLAHGLANALVLCQVIRYNASDAPVKQAAFPQYTHPEAKNRYARVADHLGLGGKTLEDKVSRLIDAVQRLKKDLDLPASIREAGVEASAFGAAVPELAANAFDDQCTGANPRYPLMSELEHLYRDAYEGKVSAF